MGAGIAAVAAAAGYDVDLVEADAGARSRLEPSARVTVYDAMPSQSDATIAIEAIVEDLEAKRAVFAAFESAVAADVPICTNTSSLAVTDIASRLTRPERALGLHFFNPPRKMALVEVVAGDRTDDATIERGRAFVGAIGKTAVLAEDTPGFIVNRVARPYYLQAMRAFAAGVAPVEDCDALARGAGFRMGPFELMDLIGLDVNLATSESIYARTGEERLQPVALQRRMVAAGTLGRKTGSGFYDYAQGPPAHDDAPPPPPPQDADESVVVIGFGAIADEMVELLGQTYARVARVENDDLLDTIPLDATIAIDVGDGTTDRASVVRRLFDTLGPDAVVFVDAYATDLARCGSGDADRLVGYGVLGQLAAQRVVEIVDSEGCSDDALELAQELFEALGKRVVLVADVPGLFLGRVVASVVNEAVTAVDEGVATPDDIDLAMRLGTNYPLGPIAWGREIGGARLARILNRLAAGEDAAFAPHRALWVLDAIDDAVAPEEADVT